MCWTTYSNRNIRNTVKKSKTKKIIERVGDLKHFHIILIVAVLMVCHWIILDSSIIYSHEFEIKDNTDTQLSVYYLELHI